MQPCMTIQLATGSPRTDSPGRTSIQRLNKLRFDFDSRVGRTFRSLPRRLFPTPYRRADEANRLQCVRAHLVQRCSRFPRRNCSPNASTLTRSPRSRCCNQSPAIRANQLTLLGHEAVIIARLVLLVLDFHDSHRLLAFASLEDYHFAHFGS